MSLGSMNTTPSSGASSPRRRTKSGMLTPRCGRFCAATSRGTTGPNLYETWVRNPLIRSLLESDDVTTTATRALRLAPHILTPMAYSVSSTSDKVFTVEHLVAAQHSFFAAVQTVFRDTRASFLGRVFNLVISFPGHLIWALRQDSCIRPYIWSSWWLKSSIPVRRAKLPLEANAVNTEGPSDLTAEAKAMQPLFRGSHQLIECACLLSAQVLQSTMEALEAEDQNAAERDQIQANISAGMLNSARLVHSMTDVLNVLAQLDTKLYQAYRPALKGTSGGDSMNLRALTRLTRSLTTDGDDLQSRGDRLLNAIHSLQFSVGLFWSAHLCLAVNANGVDSTGTAGTSIAAMFVHLEGVLNTRLNQWIPRYASSCPSASRWIQYCGAPKEVGDAIFASCDWQPIPAPPALALVDQPRALFDDDWKHVFLSHSMCPPLKEGLVPFLDLHKKHLKRLDLGYFYEKVVPRFQETVLDLLGLGPETAVNLGGNVTEMMYTVLWALRQQGPQGGTVVSTSLDFLSFRAIWKTLEKDGWKREQVAWDPNSSDLAALLVEAIKKPGRRVRLVHVTVVTSVYQVALTEKELASIIEAARSVNAVVLLDHCQGFCNVPYNFSAICKGALRDVFIMGSCVKHGRSLEGVGWCAFDPSSLAVKGAASGWCADFSVLQTPLVDPPMHDATQRLFGGTVCAAAHAELFVEQFRYFKAQGITLQKMSDRVQTLHEEFLTQLDMGKEPSGLTVSGLERRSRYTSARSKSLTMDCSKTQMTADELATSLGEMGFRVDSRNGKLLRIGFDICHETTDAADLADAIRRLLHNAEQEG